MERKPVSAEVWAGYINIMKGKLQVMVKKSKSGYSLFLKIAVREGYIVLEYRRERITKVESNHCETILAAHSVSNGYIMAVGDGDYVIDALRKCKEGRFANQFCEPSCRFETIKIVDGYLVEILVIVCLGGYGGGG